MTKINISNINVEMHIKYNGEHYEYVEDLRDALLSGQADLCLDIGGSVRVDLRELLDAGNITADCYRYTIDDYLAHEYGYFPFGRTPEGGKTPITRKP